MADPENAAAAADGQRLDRERRETWGHLDIPFDRLAFAPPPSRLSRLWIRFGPLRLFGPPPGRPDVPYNLDPCTGDLLEGPGRQSEGGRLARLLDLVMWWTAHPDARFILHAERRRARRDGMVAWWWTRARAVLAGRPTGSPPWLRDTGEMGMTASKTVCSRRDKAR